MEILSNRWPEWYEKLTKGDADDWCRLLSGYTEDDVRWACWRYRIEHDTGYAPKFSKFAAILNSRPKTSSQMQNFDMKIFFVLCVKKDNNGGGDIGRWYSFCAKNECITQQAKIYWLEVYNKLYGGVWRLFEDITRSKFCRIKESFAFWGDIDKALEACKNESQQSSYVNCKPARQTAAVLTVNDDDIPF